MPKLKLCMISGSFEYDSEESLGIFQNYLQQHHDIEPTLIVFKSEDDSISLAPIDDTDVLLVFTRRLNTDGVELERFQKYCAQGKPIVGVRTASHAFQNWLVFDKQVLGGNYQGHYGAGPITQVTMADAAASHPVLQGIKAFDSHGSLYKNTPLRDDTHLLLIGKTDQHTEPVAWTRLHKGGRIFYTSLGHQQDFREPMFLKLLANAILWAGGRS